MGIIYNRDLGFIALSRDVEHVAIKVFCSSDYMVEMKLNVNVEIYYFVILNIQTSKLQVLHCGLFKCSIHYYLARY